MFRRGRRLFSSASIVLLLMAVVHTIGHFAPRGRPAGEKLVDAAMSAYHVDMGLGMNPSVLDMLQALSLTMPITLTVWALGNLLVAATDQTGRCVKLLAWLSAAASALLIVLYAYYQIPPPLTFVVVAGILFLAAGATSSGVREPSHG